MTDSAAVRSEETQKSQVDDETTERFIAEKHIGEAQKRFADLHTLVEGFAASSKHVSPETVSQLVSCGPSLEHHLEAIGHYLIFKVGYDHIVHAHVHHVGRGVGEGKAQGRRPSAAFT